MKTNKTNLKKLIARAMLLILLITSVFGLSGCYWGADVNRNWQVNTHQEFIEAIKKFNSQNDGSVNTFISFDLDENEEISEIYYSFVTAVNKAKLGKFGLCDKICDTYSVYLIYYMKANIPNSEHEDRAYKIACHYRDSMYNFSKTDKIEIKNSNTYKGNELKSCNSFIDSFYEHGIIDSYTIENLIYNYSSHYELFVNDVEFACIHISSIEEASEEKLDEIIQMLYDNLVIINTEE
jgi:hypothetical protein